MAATFPVPAELGHGNVLSNVKMFFMNGLTTKGDYSVALRGYHSAMKEMLSLTELKPNRWDFMRVKKLSKFRSPISFPSSTQCARGMRCPTVRVSC